MTVMTKTTAGINLTRDAAAGRDNPKITFVALGSSNVPATAADTKLGNEIFRKAVTSYTNGASNGELLVSCYIAPGDAVGDNIQEIGLFAGNSATSAANTGVLVGRGLYTHNPKTNLESITIPVDITYS